MCAYKQSYTPPSDLIICWWGETKSRYRRYSTSKKPERDMFAHSSGEKALRFLQCGMGVAFETATHTHTHIHNRKYLMRTQILLALQKHAEAFSKLEVFEHLLKHYLPDCPFDNMLPHRGWRRRLVHTSASALLRIKGTIFFLAHTHTHKHTYIKRLGAIWIWIIATSSRLFLGMALLFALSNNEHWAWLQGAIQGMAKVRI